MPSAPLAISSQSRQKLKQFQFAGTSAKTEAGKENIDSNLPLLNNPGSPSEIVRHSSQTTESKQQSIFPRTPASKIPIAALISNTEDAFNGVHFDTTPEDHVSWQHGPRSSGSASSLRSTQRGKKRARSSSPASSSQIEKSNHFSAVIEPLDLQNLQQSLKTPQHDPATDLWARYSTASLAKANGDNAALPTFAQFISSPQTPDTTKSRDSVLQRSISCGIDWPTSKKKRRKLDTVEAYGRMRDIFESSKQDNLSHQVPGRSRVELLVGKIKESMLRKQSTFGGGPSSSSPLPDRVDGAILQPASPSPEQRAQQGQSGPETRQVPEPNILGENQSDLDLITEDGGSSEFGDADLDLNFLETIEMTAAQMMSGKDVANADAHDIPVAVHNILTVGKRTDQVAHEELKSAREKDGTGVLQRASPRSKPAGQHESDDGDDEFAIEDDTAFATEMQDLADRYDTQDTTSSACTTGPQKRQVHHLDSAIDSNMQRTSTDGGYENDFDDDDDDDLWDEIGKQSFPPEQLASVGSTSQVRVFC
jgi:DNA replication ATP-dependent helicase Dna2